MYGARGRPIDDGSDLVHAFQISGDRFMNVGFGEITIDCFTDAGQSNLVGEEWGSYIPADKELFSLRDDFRLERNGYQIAPVRRLTQLAITTPDEGFSVSCPKEPNATPSQL